VRLSSSSRRLCVLLDWLEGIGFLCVLTLISSELIIKALLIETDTHTLSQMNGMEITQKKTKQHLYLNLKHLIKSSSFPSFIDDCCRCCYFREKTAERSHVHISNQHVVIYFA
jgi:hypothetical protein